MALAREVFTLDDTVVEEDFAWGAKVSVGLDRLVEDFALDTLAYYHRGLEGEQHERLGAGMILGASLLTARGIPTAGEYELRTSLAMLVMDRLGAGGSFTELQALDFVDDVVEMGHDGPAHLAITAGRPLLRGLGVYHGKRGWGVSVEFDVQHGPVTLLGLGQERDGTLRASSRPRARSSPARCCRSATPPRASTSAAIPASGPTPGAPPAWTTTGRWAPATAPPSWRAWPSCSAASSATSRSDADGAHPDPGGVCDPGSGVRIRHG